MSRYIFSPHESRAGWYSVLDSNSGIRCDFEEHLFDETQEFTLPDDLPADPEFISRLMRELGEWISLHRYSEAMPVPTYEYKLSDDDMAVSIIRHKAPCFTITTSASEDTTSARFQDAIKKAGEFARKGRQQ